MTQTAIDPFEVSRAMAETLAEDHRLADAATVAVLWFPHPNEVRIVSVQADVVPSPDGVKPFHFKASPLDGLPLRSAVALILPEERGSVCLPPDWGSWADAVEV